MTTPRYVTHTRTHTHTSAQFLAGCSMQRCPFIKNRRAGLVYHLSSLPVATGLVSSPSIDQPMGIWDIYASHYIRTTDSYIGLNNNPYIYIYIYMVSIQKKRFLKWPWIRGIDGDISVISIQLLDQMVKNLVRPPMNSRHGNWSIWVNV